MPHILATAVNADDEAPRRRAGDGDIAAIKEVLWGGPRGDGLVYTVTRLAQTVERQSAAMTKLTDQVTGADGLQADLKATKIRLDEERRFRRTISTGFWGLVVPGMGWLVVRSVFLALGGHF
jgi:hypothetical protein